MTEHQHSAETGHDRSHRGHQPGQAGSADPIRRTGSLGVSEPMYFRLRRVVHAINRGYWRVEVTGAEQVPDHGPVILAPVHRSNIDFFVVAEVTPRKIFYMAKEEIWRSRHLGSLVGSLGAFPVNRNGADRLAMDRAQAVLERGDVLILFPEGTRRQGPVVQDILEGAAFLAARTGAPMVPIGVGGTDRVMPKGAKFPRPGRVRLAVGAPVLPPERSERGRVPRNKVHAMSEQLREALQQQYDLVRR